MTAGDWTTLLVGIAAVTVALTAIPESPHRRKILLSAGGLVVLALVIGVVSQVLPTEDKTPTASPSTPVAPPPQTPAPTTNTTPPPTPTPTTTPTARPTSTQAPLTPVPTPVGQTFHDVNSNNGQGSVIAEIRPDGGVEQPFTPTAYQVGFVGVVTSRDPSHGPAVVDPACPGTAVGAVRYAILDRSGQVLRESADLPACRDTATPWTLDPPLPVAAGERYILRVVNRTDTILSIYFNSVPGVEPYIRISGAIDDTAARGKSVSGRISG